MSGAQRTQWLLSMPACAVDVNMAMQEFMETICATSEQHKEATDARQKKDKLDTLYLLGFLQERNPFALDPLLRNIVTGVTADQTVNAHKAAEVGRKVLESMEGKNVMEYTFRKKNQVVTLGHRVSAKVDDEMLHVDYQLFFQRLIMVAPDVMDDIEGIFQYELCSPPSSLFETNGLLPEANKPSLADAVGKFAQSTDMSAHQDEDGMCYVIDGGSLLQRLPWSRNVTFGSICQRYVDYVHEKYRDPTVVFDGYEAGPSTKDNTHKRRSRGMIEQLKLCLQDTSGLTFTIESSSDKSMPFLDVLVTQEEESFITNVYVKPTNTGHCLNGESECPQRYKDSTIGAYIRRALTHCSTWQLMHKEIERSTQVLINNGFSERDINRQTKKILENWYNPNATKKSHDITIFYRAFFSTRKKKE
ncbi:hypothetical protein GWK47_008822 [Chionoecetes opilio]|uniref:Helix-turn-helix domain-containing protein n=1 Tax=Chionoecetes opilio TaxID=41210 RepID=A0A8J5CNF9_CHIOP|nr:hypothetical protein GWK47_008822 [Chionoecetes opilio]